MPVCSQTDADQTSHVKSHASDEDARQANSELLPCSITSINAEVSYGIEAV